MASRETMEPTLQDMARAEKDQNLIRRSNVNGYRFDFYYDYLGIRESRSSSVGGDTSANEERQAA